MTTLTAWRVLDETVANPDYKRHLKHGRGSVERFEAGRCFRIVISKEGDHRAEGGDLVSVVLHWGRIPFPFWITYHGGIRASDLPRIMSEIDWQLVGRSGQGPKILAVLRASHEVAPETWAELRGPRGYDFDVDVLDALSADPAARPILLAAMESAIQRPGAPVHRSVPATV